MSKQFIRRLSVLLAVLMLLTCLPTAALAAEFDREDPLMSAVQELAEDGQYVNIAKGKTVTATNGSDTAANAVDGNAATKWQAAPSASIEVDLGSVQRVDKIDLIWAENYPQKFKLYIAGSNKSYTDLGGLEDNSGADFIHEPETAMNIRYIKVEMLEAVAGESLSALAEIEAMQLQAEEQENLALGRPAYASAVEANVPRLGPSGAFDGKWGTYEKPTDTVPVRWASGNTVNAPQWIYVDLEQEREVGSVNICWEYPNADGKGSYATAYKVQYNNDGVDLTNDAAWTELVSVTGANGGWTPHSFAPVKARYIRLYIPQGVGMGMGSGKAVSIWEMQVFAGAVQQGMTMGELVKKLQDEPIEVKAGDTAMPTYTYNNGSLTAEVFCSDNDYVVSDSGEIKTPLVDKTVLITYVVTDQVTGQTQEVRNLPVVIPGAQSQEAGDNAMPETVPSLQEWKGAKGGVFTLTANSRIVVSAAEKAALGQAAEITKADVKDLFGFDLTITEEAPKAGDIVLTMENADETIGEQGYTMTVGGYVTVSGSTYRSVFFGTRSVLQALLASGDNTIAQGTARDYAKYAVRKVMYDVGRKYVPMWYLEDYVRYCSWLKFTDIQMHVSETSYNDHDRFRLESDIPGLTATDGYYTKDEYREFQKYAERYGVRIITEFDMPAHSAVFIKALGLPSLKNDGRHLDLSTAERRAQVYEFVERLYAEYLGDPDGDGPLEPVIITDAFNLGMDEYPNGYTDAVTEYGKFAMELVHDKYGKTPYAWAAVGCVDTANVKLPKYPVMDAWANYAIPMKTLFNQGCQIINATSMYGYIVPGGNNGYRDIQDPEKMYDGLTAGYFYDKNGGGMRVAEGHPQIAGGSISIWNDRGIFSGTSLNDNFIRLRNSMPVYAQTFWYGREEGETYAEFQAKVDTMGLAPNMHNIDKTIPSQDGEVFRYDMEETVSENGKLTLVDGSANGYDAVATNAKVENGALVLNGDGYVETGFQSLKWPYTAQFDLKLDAAQTGDVVLFRENLPAEECDGSVTNGYQATTIYLKAVGDKYQLMYDREGYHYEHAYLFEKGVSYHVAMTCGYKYNSLYVNGAISSELAGPIITGSYQDGPWKDSATLNFPLEKIGEGLHGTLDNFCLYNYEMSRTDLDTSWIPQSQMTATASTVGGPYVASNAIDGDPNTFWVSDYNNPALPQWLQLELGGTYAVNRLTYLPRPNSGVPSGCMNGTILAYEIWTSASEKAAADLTEADFTLAASGTWAENKDLKDVTFDAVEARYVRLKALTCSNPSKGAQASAMEVNVYKTDAAGHHHVYDQQNTGDKYQKTPATCVEPAVYYLSCECGQAGAETFTHGEVDPENHAGPMETRGQIEATVDQEGYTGDIYCLACEKLAEQGEVVPKLPGEPDEKPEGIFIPVEADSFDKAASKAAGAAKTENAVDFTSFGGSFAAGDYLCYPDVEFNTNYEKLMLVLSANAANAGKVIELRLDSADGVKLGEIKLTDTNGVQTFKEHYANINSTTGTHDLYLVFPQAVSVDLDFFILTSYHFDVYEGDDPNDKEAYDYLLNQTWESEAQRDERMKWFRDAGFGMFIHFGAYSTLGGQTLDGPYTQPYTPKYRQTTGAEWIMKNPQRIPKDIYREYAAADLNPVDFDAEAIVKLAQDAGQKYLVITTRHHEGFSMYDTKIRDHKDYSITTVADHGNFDRDIVRELADACEATYGTDKEVLFCAYLTLPDWYDETQYGKYGDGVSAGGNDGSHVESFNGATQEEKYANRDEYLSRLKGQVRELLVDYGAKMLWFDNANMIKLTHGQSYDLYNYIRAIKPDAIVNNRIFTYRSTSNQTSAAMRLDFLTAEQRTLTEKPKDDFESCMTLNGKWGYHYTDKNWKNPQEVIDLLMQCVGLGGNLLLNIGPDGRGNVPEESQAILREVGKWLHPVSDSIYETRTSFYKLSDLPSGVHSTAKEGKLFFHLMSSYTGSTLLVPAPANAVTGARILNTDEEIEVINVGGQLFFDLSNVTRNKYDTVIALDVEGYPEASDEEKPQEMTNIAREMFVAGKMTVKGSPAYISSTGGDYKLENIFSGTIGNNTKGDYYGAADGVKDFEAILTFTEPVTVNKAVMYNRQADNKNQKVYNIEVQWWNPALNGGEGAWETVALSESAAERPDMDRAEMYFTKTVTTKLIRLYLPGSVNPSIREFELYYDPAMGQEDFEITAPTASLEKGDFQITGTCPSNTDTVEVKLSGEGIEPVVLTAQAKDNAWTVTVSTAGWPESVEPLTIVAFAKAGAETIGVDFKQVTYGKWENYALGKTVITSTDYSGSYAGNQMVDGTTTSGGRWASLASDQTPWFIVDLGKNETVSRVVMYEWKDGGSYRAKEYKIEYSPDASGDTWTEIYRGTEIGAKGISAFEPVNARRIRVTLLDYATATKQPSIHEVEIYNMPAYKGLLAEAVYDAENTYGKLGEDLSGQGYTGESAQVYLDALNAANAVLKDKAATQAQVNKAIRDLQDAIDGLVKAGEYKMDLVFDGESLAKGDTGRAYLEKVDDCAIAEVKYTTDNPNVLVSEDGTLTVKAGYNPKAGETVKVTAVVTYYDPADVIFADNFEGTKQFTDTGADLYAHSDKGSLYGRHAATAVGKVTGHPAKKLDAVSDVTVTAWYYDNNGGADQTKFGFGINGGGTALGVFFDKNIAPYVNDLTKTHYGARVKGFTYNNYAWGATDAARSNGWHKFQWVIDSEKGLTELIDGKVISTNTIVGESGTNHELVKVENNASIKELTELCLMEDWNNNDTNLAEISNRYFIDGVTVVKNGAATKTLTAVSEEIQLVGETYTVTPGIFEMNRDYPSDKTLFITPDTEAARILIDGKEISADLWTDGRGQKPENAQNYPNEYRVTVLANAFQGLTVGEHTLTIVTEAGAEIKVPFTAVTHAARDYYLSQNGNDEADGKTPATAWKTFDKLQSVTFGPGDRIFLDAESTWSGVQFRPEGSGAPGKPIILTKYNDGGDASKRPILNGDGTLADLEAHSYLAFDAWRRFYPSGTVELFNVEHWEVSGLEVTNYTQEMQKGATGRNGIAVIYDYFETQGITELSGNAEMERQFYRAGKLQHVVIEDCYVHDVVGYHPINGAQGRGGKMSGGINAYGPYDDLKIDNNIVMYCDVEGIRNDVLAWMGDTRTQFPAYMEGVSISNNYIAGVPGDGVVISSANQPMLENNYLTDAGYSYYATSNTNNIASGVSWNANTLATCKDVATKTGALAKEMGNRNNPRTMGSTNFAGLWFIGTKDAVAQYNEAVNNVWVCNDSEAFDADMFTWGTVFQYNYTYRNNGGFCLFMGGTLKMDEGTLVRYNVSVEDAQSIGLVGGEEQNGLFHYNSAPELIHNNLFILGDKVNTIFGGASNSTYFYNNIVIAPKGLSTTGAFNGFHLNGSSDGGVQNPKLSGEIHNNIFSAGILDTIVDGSTVDLKDNIVLDDLGGLFVDLDGFLKAQPVKALLGRSDFHGTPVVMESDKGAGVAMRVEDGRKVSVPTGGFDLDVFAGIKLADNSPAIGKGTVEMRDYTYKAQNDAANPLTEDFFENDISKLTVMDIGPHQYSAEDHEHVHTTEIRNAKEANCTEAGYTGDEVCTVCGETVKQGETIPALGHNWGAWTETKAPTCTEKGVDTRTCGRCGETETREIPAYGHKTEVKNAKEATCEEVGYTGDEICTVCGTTVKQGETIPALGHTGGEATCCHEAVCERCGKDYGELDKTNHEGPKVIHNQMDPTTEHDGYTGDLVCLACGMILEKGEVIDKLPEEKPENPFIPNRPAPVKPVGPTAPEFPFTDVHENDWFYEEVKSAWENDLVDGVSATKYAPNETLTVASAIKLAAALHQMDNDGYVSLKNGAPVWYSTYVDYAVKNGVIEESYLQYTAAQMNAPVTRAEFIHIFYGAMDNYDVINDVKDGHIPDVKMTDKYADEIYTFYRAGILTGCDSKGSCRPATVITRGEVAAILIRMYDVTARVSITL